MTSNSPGDQLPPRPSPSPKTA
ncbi:hypothetical protein CORC01_05261 [Colletotrichum orchidophilum]|uniref:Uncharacterized protein n=1 Tax=Colletotrichum orchidophilum TaxID=1209926 RepID=A0A1G4BDJ5_9PEZI|nr:hypothetical protein CORC01_05261 [Colletotrichum orchidophilum]